MTPTCSDARPERILLIVDPRDAGSLVSMLQERGHSVLIAATPDEGLRAAEMDEPVLIIADLDLRSHDASLLQELTRNRPDIPVVALVPSRGMVTQLDRTRAIVFGATRVLEKPVRGKEFLGTVEAMIDARRPFGGFQHAG